MAAALQNKFLAREHEQYQVMVSDTLRKITMTDLADFPHIIEALDTIARLNGAVPDFSNVYLDSGEALNPAIVKNIQERVVELITDAELYVPSEDIEEYCRFVALKVGAFALKLRNSPVEDRLKRIEIFTATQAHNHKARADFEERTKGATHIAAPAPDINEAQMVAFVATEADLVPLYVSQDEMSELRSDPDKIAIRECILTYPYPVVHYLGLPNVTFEQLTSGRLGAEKLKCLLLHSDDFQILNGRRDSNREKFTLAKCEDLPLEKMQVIFRYAHQLKNILAMISMEQFFELLCQKMELILSNANSAQHLIATEDFLALPQDKMAILFDNVSAYYKLISFGIASRDLFFLSNEKLKAFLLYPDQVKFCLDIRGISYQSLRRLTTDKLSLMLKHAEKLKILLNNGCNMSWLKGLTKGKLSLALTKHFKVIRLLELRVSFHNITRFSILRMRLILDFPHNYVSVLKTHDRYFLNEISDEDFQILLEAPCSKRARNIAPRQRTYRKRRRR